MVEIYILTSVVSVSLISLIGILFLTLSKKTLNKIIWYLVSFSIGVFLGVSFLHILPESFEKFSNQTFILCLIGIILFFFLESFLWRHCHEQKCKIHPYTYLSLIGDSIHNFLDGIAIAISFYFSFDVGIATTLAAIMHEIPQEISDFSVLLSGGFKLKKVLLFNFLSSLTAISGAFLIILLKNSIDLSFLLPVTAGAFIYIALSDLIPYVQKKVKVLPTLLLVIFGILIFYLFKF